MRAYLAKVVLHNRFHPGYNFIDILFAVFLVQTSSIMFSDLHAAIILAPYMTDKTREDLSVSYILYVDSHVTKREVFQLFFRYCIME